MLVSNLILKLSPAQTLFELDYRINIFTTDGISAVRTASECVILAAELHRVAWKHVKCFYMCWLCP